LLPYPNIDPVALQLGPLTIHWYGLAYLLSFLLAWAMANWLAGRPGSPLQRNQVEDLIFFGAIGVILGGRLGYGMFYQLDYWLEDPLWIFRLWEGGMSFHGGLLGVIAVLFWYARRLGQPFLALTDFTAPLVPIGLLLGRIGNFIGQELWGRPTDAWYGMVFPRDPSQLARHPSQLYQAALEGLLLFLVLLWVASKPRPRGFASGIFLLLYSGFRFLVEFVREPDSHLQDLLFGWMSRGQALSVPMAALGCFLIYHALNTATPKDSK
jgi:phosphatidylglycerol---prolipoprotein diacylglyceryl transferase